MIGDRICARSTSTPVQYFASSGAQTSDFETWLSALPLVGIYFTLLRDCLTSRATRGSKLRRPTFVSGPSNEAEAHFDALARSLFLSSG